MILQTIKNAALNLLLGVLSTGIPTTLALWSIILVMIVFLDSKLLIGLRSMQLVHASFRHRYHTPSISLVCFVEPSSS